MVGYTHTSRRAIELIGIASFDGSTLLVPS
jgi:hypothetical protein